MVAAHRTRWRIGTAVAALLFATTPGHVHGQTGRIRVESAAMASPLVTAPRLRATDALNLATHGIRRTGAVARGALIGGGIGLVVSVAATVLYVESTDGSNYTGPMLGLGNRAKCQLTDERFYGVVGGPASKGSRTL